MDRYAETENLILHGRLKEARHQLKALTDRKVERPDAVRIANLLRRAWLPETALRLLHPYIRPSLKRGRVPAPASEDERAEYAASLILIEAHREGMSLLEDLDPRSNPEVYFTKGLGYFSLWDWEATLGFWDEVEANRSATPLQKLRAKLYHAIALVHGPGRHDEALAICESIADQAGPGKHRMVHKSRLLTVIQARALMGGSRSTSNKTEEEFREIEALCAEESDERFFRHALLWRCIARKDRRGILSARQEFKASRSWEQVRVADYYLALIEEDRDRLVHLHFGTPYPAFRRRIEKALGGESALSESYDLKLWDGNKLGPTVIDLASGAVVGTKAFLKKDQAMHRCLRSLVEDFVMPPTIARLHEAVYGEENFNPFSTPDKMHQLLKRVRSWIEENRISLEVREDAGFYRLFSPKGCVIRVPRAGSEAKAADPAIEQLVSRLKKSFGRKAFSSQAAADCLGISYTSAKRHLARAQGLALLERQGAGPATRYTIK